jgi:soluble cytochrome b562
MKLLLKTLDEALDDVEQGKVQTLEEAWVEIDNI